MRRKKCEICGLGADDYITKPFTQKDLLDAIDARVRRQRPFRDRLEELARKNHPEIGANWSHELLTPLTGLLGGLEMIESEADHIKPGELRELLGFIRAGAERQEELSLKLILHFELERLLLAPPTPNEPCLSKAVEVAAQRGAGLAKRTADLTTFVEPAHLPLAERHLTGAMLEVVDNAFRFSAAGQPVTVAGRRHDRRYRIEITDAGLGMTPEQCQAIGPFKQFERAKREQQGLGLGLAIAQSTAKIAGGRFHVEPGPGGHGLIQAGAVEVEVGS